MGRRGDFGLGDAFLGVVSLAGLVRYLCPLGMYSHGNP